MRYASIDIGTNTVLLLVAEVNDHRVFPVREEQRVPRLGKGVSSEGVVLRESMERVINVLNEYSDILKTTYPDIKKQDVTVTATSAVRDAENREEFVKKVKKESGYPIRILSGVEEAEWTFTGALSVLEKSFSENPAAVIDIGGGSTEIACGSHSSLIDRHSFQMGSVRFTERYLKDDPPDNNQIRRCIKAVEQEFGARSFQLPEECRAIGVAGTVTSLAYLVTDSAYYNPSQLNGYRIQAGHVKNWIHRLSRMTIREMISEWPEIMTGRADIFIAGLLILQGFMNVYKLNEMTVSTGGIRYGAVINKAMDKF